MSSVNKELIGIKIRKISNLDGVISSTNKDDKVVNVLDTDKSLTETSFYRFRTLAKI